MVKAGYGGASAEASSKEMLIGLAVILGIIVVILWYLKKTASDAIGSITNAPSAAMNAITNAVTARETAQTSAIATAATGFGATSDKIKTAMAQYNNMVSPGNIGVISSGAVNLGNIIAPTSTLEAAAQAGKDFTDKLQANNDSARYQALDPVSKGLVTFGEAITTTLTGISPYDSGQTVRNWWDTLTGAKI